MALQFHDSPFHVTHDADTASEMARKMDLSISITYRIKKLRPKRSEDEPNIVIKNESGSAQAD